MVCRCGEGFGEKNFEEWIVNKSVDEMIQDISEKFLLGAHKAAAIAMVLRGLPFILFPS